MINTILVHTYNSSLDTDESPMVAGAKSNIFWSTLLGLSLVIIVGTSDLRTVAVFLASAAVVCGAVLSYRLGAFRRRETGLLESGQSLEAYDYSKQVRKLYYLIAGVASAFLVPFFLSGFLDVSTWLGSIVGVTDGWVSSLIFYNAYLYRWQKVHGGKLYFVHVWRGTKVTQSGVRFERAGGSR
jgi:hypothetical protein